MGSKSATWGYKCWGKVLLGSKWISRLCNIIIMSDFHMCCNAQTKPKKCNFTTVTYHREGLSSIQVLKFEIPAKNEGRILSPNILTFSHKLKFLRPGLTHSHKNCTRQTSGCVDQLLLQAIDNISYFVLMKYLVEKKLQNRHAFWAHLSHLIYTKITLHMSNPLWIA